MKKALYLSSSYFALAITLHATPDTLFSYVKTTLNEPTGTTMKSILPEIVAIEQQAKPLSEEKTADNRIEHQIRQLQYLYFREHVYGIQQNNRLENLHQKILVLESLMDIQK